MNTRARSPLLGDATLFELSPDHVDEGSRIGFLHGDKAAALGRLMAVDGQRDPIKVVANPDNADKPWRLVTGMHRLIGARIEGLTVWAIEVHGKPEDLADLEASENLHRRPLAPIERAKFTAALVLAAQERLARETGELSQHKRAIKARWDRVKVNPLQMAEALRDEVDDTSANLARVYGWEQSIGEALDMSRRAIYRAMQLYRCIIEPFPELVEPLARHPVVGENDKQLRDIADIKDVATRRSVIELLLADPELSADEAKRQAGIGLGSGPTTPPPPHQKHFDAITGGWGRLGVSERRRFIETNLLNMLSTPDLLRRAQTQISAALAEQDSGDA